MARSGGHPAARKESVPGSETRRPPCSQTGQSAPPQPTNANGRAPVDAASRVRGGAKGNSRRDGSGLCSRVLSLARVHGNSTRKSPNNKTAPEVACKPGYRRPAVSYDGIRLFCLLLIISRALTVSRVGSVITSRNRRLSDAERVRRTSPMPPRGRRYSRMGKARRRMRRRSTTTIDPARSSAGVCVTRDRAARASPRRNTRPRGTG
jgi:hypothetical protein